MKSFGIRGVVSSLSLCCIIWLFVGSLVSAADWPCWRGANRNGLSSETGLLRNWTEESQPVLVWKNSTVGQTTNGIAVWGNLIYTIGVKGGSECVFCIDNQSGKTLWTRPIGKSAGKKGKFPVVRSTPTIYKELLYVVSSSGNLVCMNAGDGATRWVRNMITTMGGVLPQGGYCESPYVDGKWVIVCPGGPAASMVAIDRHWGMNVWVARTGMASGYSSIMKASFGREHQYVDFMAGGLVGVKVKGGDVRWCYEAPAHESGYNACPPIWFGQTILASSAAGTGCVWIQKDGSAYKTSEVWFNEDLKVPTGDMMKVNDYVFACTDEEGMLCFNYKTGEKVWGDKTLFASVFEEDVDDTKSKKSGSKSAASRKTSSLDSRIPLTVSVNRSVLAEEESSSAKSDAKPIEIARASKGKKKKMAPPPAAPKCMGTIGYAEGLLYVRTSAGELVLMEASPEGCKIRGRITKNQIPQMKPGLTPSPVIANGYLYLREGSTIFCFDIRDKSRKQESSGGASDGSDSGNGGTGGKAIPGMPTGPGVQQRKAPKLG